jgi:hypothetical protein
LLPILFLCLALMGCMLPQRVQVVNDHPFPVQISVSYDERTHHTEGRGEEPIATVSAHTTSASYDIRRGERAYWFRFRRPDGETVHTLHWSRGTKSGPCIIEIGPSGVEVSRTLRWSWSRISSLLLWAGAIGWLLFLGDTLRRALRR